MDILFCDASGHMIETKPIRFAPKSVGQSRRSSRMGYYSLSLQTLAGGTTRIVVQAHDADIGAPHNGSNS